MDGKCETVTETLAKTIPINNQKYCEKKTHTRKVKLNRMKGVESLEITQRVGMKKQRIQYIFNVNNIGENDQDYIKIRKSTHKTDKHNSKKSSASKSRKHKVDYNFKIKSPETYKTESRSFDKRKTFDNCKIDLRSYLNKCKNLDKHEAVLNYFLKNKSLDKEHNKSLHSSRTINDSLSSKNRIVPICMRDGCRLGVSLKTCYCLLKKEKKKLKKKRKREAKLDCRRDISLSPISSPSMRQREISYDNVSSDGLTSYTDYDIRNKIDRLIKRTKDREKRKYLYTNDDSRPNSTSTPNPDTGLPKQGRSYSEPSLELVENAIDIISIGGSDENKSEICNSHSAHSIHSQATLILDGHRRTPSSTTKDFENPYLYSPADPIGNHTYSPSLSPKNNIEYYRDGIPSSTPCFDVPKTSYYPYSNPDDTKTIPQTVDKPIGDFNYSAPQLSTRGETFSGLTGDQIIPSTVSTYTNSTMPSYNENNINVNTVNDINQYYNYDCNTNIGQYYPAPNQGISETIPSTMPQQSYADTQTYQYYDYYYQQGMYAQSQLSHIMQPEMAQMQSAYNGLPAQNEYNNNSYFPWYCKDKENNI